MSIRSGQKMKKSNDWIFSYKINKNHFSCHGNSTHLSQNARINPSAGNLDACKKKKRKKGGAKAVN